MIDIDLRCAILRKSEKNIGDGRANMQKHMGLEMVSRDGLANIDMIRKSETFCLNHLSSMITKAFLPSAIEMV